MIFEQKKTKKRINYAWFMPQMMLVTYTTFTDVLHITLPKLPVSFPKNFLSKGSKSVKKHKLCIIMLINSSLYNSFETNTFNLQITIDRVDSV